MHVEKSVKCIIINLQLLYAEVSVSRKFGVVNHPYNSILTNL